MNRKLLISAILLCIALASNSQLSTHHVFDNNMVLQRNKPVKVWGWAVPGTEVVVRFADQVKKSFTADSGEWTVHLDPMKADNTPRELIITADTASQIFSNVVVGDVWILGGQSNMEFDLARIFNGDLEIECSRNPDLRILTLPRAESQNPLEDFERLNEYDGWYDRYDLKGYWFVSSPEHVKTFSGLGYIFGSRVQRASGVPIGLIDVSRGGTTVETWLSPSILKAMPENKELMDHWNMRVEEYDPDENLKQRIKNWEKRTESRKKQGLEPGPKPTEPSPSPYFDHNFPGVCYNGYIAPIKDFAVKGIIFHHGYNNALSDARPDLYATNFKALIKDWRKTFNDENLPFGIIELSAGGAAQTLGNFELMMVDAAPYIREGQYLAYRNMANVGFISAYDQQVNWYHPQKKTVLGDRTARWALSEYYEKVLPWKPAEIQSFKIIEDTIVLTFDREVKTHDDRPISGFAISDPHNHFYPATAEYIVESRNINAKAEYNKASLKIWNPLVKKPVALRYAWARNPLGNLVNNSDRIIPVPAFRTDKWDYPEAPFEEKAYQKHREHLRSLSQKAFKQCSDRIAKEN